MRKHTAIILLAVAFVLTGCKDETKEKDLKTALKSKESEPKEPSTSRDEIPHLPKGAL